MLRIYRAGVACCLLICKFCDPHAALQITRYCLCFCCTYRLSDLPSTKWCDLCGHNSCHFFVR